ncbi:exonuclease domain-containing protein [Sporosarcina thermotolerans]|uniref:Exonuclease domain-containing protein n=1 Tax=Sporosarcina thermotolerans TaxID=633404 RepID=A0AAW9A8Y3_9BACL|nr:exonuclease domain-containing protein [Sporosarcina thermotolerans]MDW0116350.1 exonuclease domain-containing protein [Sporosarcina thermotolerans]
MSPNRKATELLQSKTNIQNWGARRASRKRKFKTTSKHVNDYIVLDFETTGFRAGADRIIQIGALKFINHERVEVLNTFINPERHIPLTITRLTGITNEMVEWAPTIEQKIYELIEFIGEFPIIAHNASFDMGFLYALDNIQGIQIPEYTVIDTVPLARKTITETPNHKLGTLAKYLQLEHDAHDAIGDCLATAAIYQYCTAQ